MNLTELADINTIKSVALDYGLNIIFAIAIFFFGRIIAKYITKGVVKALNRAGYDDTLSGFLKNIVYALLLAFVIIAALSQLGVQTTSLAAIFAAAGLAIGLALQGSLANFAAGVMIIAFKPFKSGDYIDAASISGTAEDVGIFATTLRTPDNKTIIVPNGEIMSNPITNYSARKRRRIDMTFGIGYDDDIRKAKDVLKEILHNDERVLKDPAPVIAVGELAESSVNFVVRPWVKTEDYWSVLFDTTEAVKLRFDKEGISIPFPQQDVNMKQVTATNTQT